MLNVKIKTKPITRLLRFIHVPFFYVGGGHFRITAHMKNFDTVRFQGGVLTIFIRYAFGNLREIVQTSLKAIEPQEEVKVDFEGHDIWGVLAQGHALFWAYVVDSAGKTIDLCDEKGGKLPKQLDWGSHVHTFHSLGFGELCALLALLVNTIAFVANILLTSFVNIEKLSVLWNTVFYSIPVSTIVTLTFLAIVSLWLVFVYVLYDRYGLYR